MGGESLPYFPFGSFGPERERERAREIRRRNKETVIRA